MINIVDYYLENLVWPKKYLEDAVSVSAKVNDAQITKKIKFVLKKIKEKNKCHC